MTHVRLLLLILLVGYLSPDFLQAQQRAMAWDDVTAWQRITEKIISDDGRWIACKMEPWRGDAIGIVYNQKGEEVKRFQAIDKISFSSSGNYLLVTLKPALEKTEALKLKKTKKEDMPMNRLAIYSLGGQEEIIDSLKSYKLSENADWLAYQRGKNDSTLYVRSLDGKTRSDFPTVASYGFAKEENKLYYQVEKKGENASSGLYVYAPAKEAIAIYEGKGSFKQITFDNKGDKIAFVYSPEKDSTSVDFSLFLSENEQPAHPVTKKDDAVFPTNWMVSPHATLRFSENSDYLSFGIAPCPKVKDSTILAENYPNVQVWKWDEGVQYTQQTANKKKDLQKSYTSIYNLKRKQVIPLATPDMASVEFTKDMNVPVALGRSAKCYETQRMWRGKERVDLYLLELDKGDKQLITEGLIGRTELSPAGKYAFWYNLEDSCWYTYSIQHKKEICLTTPTDFIAWNEDNDVPDFPNPHGVAGWTKDDKYLLIYDRYDIWQFDPEGNAKPVNLTVNGRKEDLSYRRATLDKDEKFIDPAKEQILIAMNEKTKGYGYYQAKFSSPAVPNVLLSGNYKLRVPLKAKKSDAVVYSVETFEKYPDLFLSDLRFKQPVQLTEGYKQQDGLNWGTAELISWLSLDGIQLEGVIYKPANFDPAKKYPLIVNFYERNSETLYDYRMPEPHRSTIDYHFYTSNEYIVFNPDIRYKEGYPGESCFNSVMPGIAAIVSQGYINEKAIGAQGHSWGGYQVAYLATRTNLFAAIESGAPVVNMFSAYGGIRWETGLNRSFQYEHGQSRIGGTIWETPYRYEENSPLFTMDKVQTPILIMHNDADGHVPWYQGIEYFVALKRLQKPVWMLNYTGEPHWPTKLPNKVDFQIRMFQFFEHYLNNKPMPKWMAEGVPAVDQEFELGY